MILGRIFLHRRQGFCGLNYPLAAKKGAPRLSYQPAQMWSKREQMRA